MKVVKSLPLSIGGREFATLILDSEALLGRETNAVVDGGRYELVYMSGADFNAVSIKGIHNFTGKEITFV